MQVTLLFSVSGACDLIPVWRWHEQAAAVWYESLSSLLWCKV